MDTRTTLRLMILTVVGAGLVWSTGAAATPACPPGLKHRPPAEVLADHRAALAAQDWDAARCNFTEDAVMIGSAPFNIGVDAIIAEFQLLAQFLDGPLPGVHFFQELILPILNGDRHIARVLWASPGTCFQIPDSADTYVIRRGKIVAMTWPGLISGGC